MKNRMNALRAHAALFLAFLSLSCGGYAAPDMRDPMSVINALADRIYVAGERSGDVGEMIAAEVEAAEEIRLYLASGSTEGLLARDKNGRTPLAAAAYMGYPNVVAALLASDLVKAHIDDEGSMGMTPWIAANLSLRQSFWTCNPTIFNDPFKFMPMLVTQPYYVANPTPPYKKVRELLEQAGASASMQKAKRKWMALCKHQSSEAKAKVRASQDLQETVQILGAVALIGHLIETGAGKTDNKGKD